jgi:hypothetical protein
LDAGSRHQLRTPNVPPPPPPSCTFPAGEAIKALARCLFDFHKADLTAACKHQRTLNKDWEFLSDEQLVALLPLKTWKRLRHACMFKEQAAG